MNSQWTERAPWRIEPPAVRWMLRLLSNLACGRLDLTLPDGRVLTFNGRLPGAHATLRLADWRVCGDILRKGDIGLAECYIDGRAGSDDLSGLLLLAAQNSEALEQAVHGRWWATLAYRLRHWLRPNTRSGSRRNIHAHYDLGNDFYALWLDETMTYSAALFGGDTVRSLSDAQQAKYRRILRELDVREGDHILEIGCGWGGFAEVAARAGCRVTGITISQEQFDFAQERLRKAGLQDRVTLKMADYRDIAGTFDHVVSIEMFEAVGERYWPAFFSTVKARLKTGGRAVVQTITIADSKFNRYREGTDFIQQYIFPGGMLPSPYRFDAALREAGLLSEARHAFGNDYAATLRHWHHRFNAAEAVVRAQGFDERFIRTWRFYLAYCEAGFRTAATDVMQFTLRHA